MAYVNLIDIIYPVGAVYISYTSTNPQVLFGGSWTAITGVFPYFNAGTGTGGSNTHTLTVAEMPNHSHTLHSGTWDGQYKGYLTFDTSIVYNNSRNGTAFSFGAEPNGGGRAHNNMPAYQTFYAWRRTA